MRVISFIFTLLLMLSLAFHSDSASAQSNGCEEERDVGGKALDEVTWKRLSKIHDQVSAEDYQGATEELNKMLEHSAGDDYLQAVIYQALAQVEWSLEKYDTALKFFEKTIELDALPNHAHFALMYQISHIYFMQDRFDDALQRLELWFCTAPADKIDSAAYVLKASILVQMKNYREALQAIEMAIDKEPKPQEGWYQLKLAAHYELEQYPLAAETLELMISHWPDTKSYWTQLAQTYFNLKQDDRALAITALAYRKQLLDSQTDIIYLSNLYSNSEVPYKAADVLQKGIEDGIVESTERMWTSVGANWYSAEELEKALGAYEKAGEASETGDIDLRRAYILVDLERWGQALTALNGAISKGGLSELKLAEAYLLRGMAAFNLDDFDLASSDWLEARNSPETSNTAAQWISHLEDERRRRQP
jgi:tetratricopeptide (TPR) repeat protein